MRQTRRPGQGQGFESSTGFTSSRRLHFITREVADPAPELAALGGG